MRNKISNNDVFEDYIGKYITLIQDGVKKKYYVNEINKNSFLSNVSILKGENGTDYSFSSAGILQRCFICDYPCISSVPIIQFEFEGMASTQYAFFTKNYYDEMHDIYLNDHKISTVNTSILSAMINKIYFIPSDYIFNINLNDVWDNRDYATYFNGKTTAFSACYFDYTFYNRGGLNKLRIQPVYADNQNTKLWYRYNIAGTNIPNSAFFISFCHDNGVNSGIIRKKMVTNSVGTSSTGQYTLSCQKWNCNSFTSDPNAQPYLLSDINDGYINPHWYWSNFNAIWYDLDPCTDPENYIPDYSYENTLYYTDPYKLGNPIGLNYYYEAYKPSYLTPENLLGCPPHFNQMTVYSAEDMNPSSKISLYRPRWEFMNTIAAPSEIPDYCLDYGKTNYNGYFYIIDRGVDNDADFNQKFRFTIENGIETERIKLT